MQEMPSITASAYLNTTVDHCLIGGNFNGPRVPPHQDALMRQMLGNLAATTPKGSPIMSTARIVKVFIADPDENIPLDKRVIYSRDEKLTDSTDQELFFEVPIGELLATQNALRAATVNKKASEKSGRDVFLEPARIRDLRMVVVTVAQF